MYTNQIAKNHLRKKVRILNIVLDEIAFSYDDDYCIESEKLERLEDSQIDYLFDYLFDYLSNELNIFGVNCEKDFITHIEIAALIWELARYWKSDIVEIKK